MGLKFISAIMLTRARPGYAKIALDAFMKQTYPQDFLQLLIVDDRDEPSFREAPKIGNVSYVRDEMRDIAAKRNLACRLAAADILCNWDDDDWSAPERIADQVARLIKSEKNVTGYNSMLFYEVPSCRTAKYTYGDSSYALGTSLMFTRQWWDSHPFHFREAGEAVGEDNAFVREAKDLNELVTADGGQFMVARVHAGNTSVKDMNKFSPVPITSIPQGFFQ